MGEATATLDLPAFATALGRALRAAGVGGGPDRAARFARALALQPPPTRARLYWTARVTFVSDHAQLATFDRVFAAIFAGFDDRADRRGEPAVPQPPGARPGERPPPAVARPIDRPPRSGAAASARLGARTDGKAEPQAPAHEVPVAASAAEVLRETDFAELDRDELVALRQLMRRVALAPPPRRTRRTRRGRRGERLDVRATLRESRRSAGDPVHQVRRRRRLRPRRLVLLCDVSGSMEPYTRAFLMLLHGAVGGANAEAFVFATRLTRLTRALATSDPDAALDRAATAAPDWAGGTRIGEALRRFLDDWGRRGMARGAVVVIVSDGWERGDPALVAREMARLRRLAYRVVWVNPRKAQPGFAPLAGGMAAALPFCDAFVSGHSLAALGEVADAIAADRRATAHGDTPELDDPVR
jgi:uncharacterized protein with von Willebrand factor type A (vWA) domain